jgi:hypothetical protein
MKEIHVVEDDIMSDDNSCLLRRSCSALHAKAITC